MERLRREVTDADGLMEGRARLVFEGGVGWDLGMANGGNGLAERLCEAPWETEAKDSAVMEDCRCNCCWSGLRENPRLDWDWRLLRVLGCFLRRRDGASECDGDRGLTNTVSGVTLRPTRGISCVVGVRPEEADTSTLVRKADLGEIQANQWMSRCSL